MSTPIRTIRSSVDLEAQHFQPSADRRQRIYPGAGRVPATGNPWPFLFTVLFLLMFLNNSTQFSTHFLISLGLLLFVMGTCLRILAVAFHHAATHAPPLPLHRSPGSATLGGLPGAGGLGGGNALDPRLPQGMAIVAAMGRLRGLSLQLALLNRELNELDYDALRALDTPTPSTSMSSGLSATELNRLPTYMYKTPRSPAPVKEGAWSSGEDDGAPKRPQDFPSSSAARHPEAEWAREIECTVCLERVEEGDLLRTLPCLHQFHVKCIDPWLEQQATCPICKFKLAQRSNDGEDRLVLAR